MPLRHENNERMKPLYELVDLIASNPSQFPDHLSYLISRFPPSSLPCLSRSHLHSLLALSRFAATAATSSNPPLPSPSPSPNSILLNFFRSLSFRPFAWPQPFNLDSVSSFLSEFVGHLSTVAKVNPDFVFQVGDVVGDAVALALGVFLDEKDESGLCKAFLRTVARSNLPVGGKDGERLVGLSVEEKSIAFHSQKKLWRKNRVLKTCF